MSALCLCAQFTYRLVWAATNSIRNAMHNRKLQGDMLRETNQPNSNRKMKRYHIKWSISRDNAELPYLLGCRRENLIYICITRLHWERLRFARGALSRVSLNYEMHYERINDISKTSVASIIALSILETLKLKLLLEIDNFYQMQFLHLLNINCQRY